MKMKKNKKDFVWVVKQNGNDTELRWSIRSVELHATNLNNIVIVGHCPDWLDKTKIIHIEGFEGSFKEYNIAKSLYLAAKSEMITEDFIYMNDDFFLNAKYGASNQKTYARPVSLSEFSNKKAPEGFDPLTWNNPRFNGYSLLIANTAKFLKSLGLGDVCYDIHVPMPISCSKYLEAFELIKDVKHPGVTPRSVYGNLHKIKPTIINDVKFSKCIDPKGFVKAVSKLPFFSTNDGIIESVLEEAMLEIYKNGSKYEK